MRDEADNQAGAQAVGRETEQRLVLRRLVLEALARLAVARHGGDGGGDGVSAGLSSQDWDELQACFEALKAYFDEEKEAASNAPSGRVALTELERLRRALGHYIGAQEQQDPELARHDRPALQRFLAWLADQELSRICPLDRQKWRAYLDELAHACQNEQTTSGTENGTNQQQRPAPCP